MAATGMSFSAPPAKLRKLSTSIGGLADADLSEIFKRLPPFERLIVSEVCRRWHHLARKAWLDVKSLDLCPIPGKHIGAILKQCPNLQSILSVEDFFGSKDLFALAEHSNLSSVKLYSCEFGLDKDTPDILQNVFSDNVENTAWTELVLNDAIFDVRGTTGKNKKTKMMKTARFAFSATILPTSLTRLQLSGVYLNDEFDQRASLFLNGLERLQNLECFILLTSPETYEDTFELVEDASGFVDIFEKICCLKNLKELCVGLCRDYDIDLGHLISSLPKLEVLFLRDLIGEEVADDLEQIITTNSVLRILVLSGEFAVDAPIEFPARKRFPNGFAGDPLPLLHVFVGIEASENTRFAKSASSWALVWPISEPMPEFFERADVAPIFQGVWVAEKIKETAQRGGRLWDYASDTV